MEEEHVNGFPFPPYAIQRDLMQQLHVCLDRGGIGFFESPTGTGKSLSLICGLLSWLERSRFADAPPPAAPTADDGLDSVLAAHLRKMRRAEHEQVVAEARTHREELLRAAHGVEPASYADGLQAAVRKKAKSSPAVQGAVDDGEWLLSDGAAADAALRDSSSDDGEGDDKGVSKALRLLRAGTGTTKIFYTSRTHTQLAQFIGEVRKTRHAQQTLVAPMASRSALCVHEPVKRLASTAAVNDACQSLRDKRGGCPCNKGERVATLALRGLGSVTDVEELAAQGSKGGACAYYASRHMLTQADLVVLPYQMLLHAGTREALGIELANAVVVVDEAHNIADAINSVYGAHLSAAQISASRSMLAAYLERYRSRLSHANLINLRQLETIVAALDQLSRSTAAGFEALLTVTQFTFDLNADNLNLFQLLAFVRGSHLANVMRGFQQGIVADQGDHGGDDDDDGAAAVERRGAFHALTAFLEALTCAEGEGRILVQKKPRFRVEFLLLSPERCFADMARQAKAVILAGGTLSPVPALVKQLLPADDAALHARVMTFSCGHVVPPENLLVLSVSCGPTDRALDLSFKSRDDKALLDEVCAALINVRRVTPAGMVVFFTSYAFEARFHQHCAAAGTSLARLGAVYRDARLADYTQAIERGEQASLWAVVGGTLSEGINFSDDLGRCVVMVGVPFANSSDVVLQERVARLGQAHYAALAARALNQCIGRAIRHAADHAAVVLLDARYERLAPDWLPVWMARSLKHVPSFGQGLAALAAFFRSKRARG